ncbi:MAG: histidinol dehydrogenase [Gemmatimonadales bacterium]
MSNVTVTPSGANRLTRVVVPPWDALRALLPAGGAADAATRNAVEAILGAVRVGGDQAVAQYQRTFDHDDTPPTAWEVPTSAWHAARERLDPALRAALALAVERVRAFHEQQRVAGFELALPDGSRVGSRVVPLDAVGVYVPGGTAAYPSSVIMNVVPAVVAGVPVIVAVTPPGQLTDAVLAACAMAGVTRLFRIGGAQACAALAYGTATIPRVDKIVGPGNRFVAEAKRQLVGTVGIDMVAGPTEILIVADAGADPRHVAADLIAQAEHDRDASAWVVTTSAALLDAVDAELERQLAVTPRKDIAMAALAAHGVGVLTPDLGTALAVTNLRAPEHLELLVHDPRAALAQVRHAGAVFVGASTPEPVGDYLAGPSHVLPTAGTARFASPLGVHDFVRHMSVVEYTPARLAADAEAIIALAEAEGLAGHANAVRIRR